MCGTDVKISGLYSPVSSHLNKLVDQLLLVAMALVVCVVPLKLIQVDFVDFAVVRGHHRRQI